MLNKAGGLRQALVFTLGAILLAAMIYTVIEGIFEIVKQIAMVLMLLLPCAFLDKPLRKTDSRVARNAVLAADLVLAGLAAAVGGYIFFGFDAFYERLQLFNSSPMDLTAGIVLGVLLLEGARRHIGLPMVFLCLIAIFYVLWGQYLPDAFASAPFSLSSIGVPVLLGTNGVFGPALQVTAQEVYAFILFGAVLEALGAGTIFMRIASGLTRRSYGGPAKAAVVGSSLMGTISGSAIANVVMTGSITIPMMKRAGFKSHVAASIEAVSSSGGQIMPPVMGATAFVIAAYTGTTYSMVALQALIPALLFYLSIFLNVHLLALRDEIKPLNDAVTPWSQRDIGPCLAIGLSIGLLIYLLVTHFPTMLTGFYAAGALVLATLPIREMRVTTGRIFAAVMSLTRAMIVIAVACGAAGIIMGIVLQSGLGAELSSLLLSIADGNIYVLAVLTAVVSIILGMGLPTIVVYIFLATLIAPALVQGGISVMSAHLFVFYYGVVALLTPPLAVAAYTAAGIAGSDPTRTGYYAAWFALGKYVVPIMFLFSPALIAEGPLWLIFTKLFYAVLALASISLAVIGYFYASLGTPSRVGFLMAAGLLGAAPLGYNAGGLALFALLVLANLRTAGSGRQVPRQADGP